MDRFLCRHCQRKYIKRPRGLCWLCYMTTDIRSQYLLLEPGTLTQSEIRDHDGPAPAPQCPTPAGPGSDEKIAAMAARASAGQSLFHPFDGWC
jgi:hypothetical protein